MKRCPYRNALKVCCFCIQTFSNIKVSVSSIILGNTKLRLTVLVLWRNVRICDRSPCCTCSHSRIMCESHAYGLNALISSIKDNFSHLTHKSTQIVLKRMIRDWSKSIGAGGGGVGRSREGVGHEVLSLVQGVGRAIFSYPQGVGHPIFY